MYRFLGMLFIIFLFSCSKERKENIKAEQGQNANHKVLDRIKELGFTSENIVENKDYYLVEGDIIFLKSDTVSSKLKQNLNGNLVTKKIIMVYLNPNFGTVYNSHMSNVLDRAITIYHDLQFYIIFVRTSNPSLADIQISSNNSLGIFCGESDFPTLDGLPGKRVLINGDKLTTNDDQTLLVLIHELGHTLGLAHTDGAGSLIAGTPATDLQSIMNSGTCGKVWTDFSFYDKIAFSTLYPLPQTPSSETIEGDVGTVTLPSGQTEPTGVAAAATLYSSKIVNGTAFGGFIPRVTYNEGPRQDIYSGGAHVVLHHWKASYSGTIYLIK